MIYLLVFVLFIGINIALAYQNNEVRLKRIATNNTKQIEHFFYGLGYLVACIIPLWISGWQDWLLFFSILLLHISIFPVFYNTFSGVPTFNLSKTTTALTDQLMVELGLTNTAAVNIIAFIISIILLII